MLSRRSIGLFLLLFVFVLIFGNALAQDGDFLMDIGFRPENDGFSFENYGDNIPATNLTPAEMVLLFGEAVCSSEIDDEGYCDLTPNAQLWMEQVSEAMAGGHCEGMAVLSLLFYGEYYSPVDYGADYTVELEIEDNEYLQREIALWWATQATFPAYTTFIQGAPSEIVEALVNSMEDEYFTIGFYLPDRTGGHAVSPYAVVDQGDGIYLIMIYDNNYPGEERFIEVDTNEETWVYTGSTNPAEPDSEYYGDADTMTLELAPMEPRLETQICDFCGDAGFDDSEESYTGISLNGAGSLTVTDSKGNRAGIVDGKLVNEIPGARIIANKNAYASNRPPSFYIPNGIGFVTSIVSGGFGKPATGVTVTQRGSVATLSGITLSNKEATLGFENGNIRYNSAEGDDDLTFRQGVSAQSGKDYLYEVNGSSSSLYFEFDPESGDIRISGDDDGSTFSVGIERYNEDGTHDSFYDEEVDIDGGMYGDLNASEWDDEMDIGYEDEDGNELDLEDEMDDSEDVIDDSGDEEIDDSGDEFDDSEDEIDDSGDEFDDSSDEFDDSADDGSDDSADDSSDDSSDDGGDDSGD